MSKINQEQSKRITTLYQQGFSGPQLSEQFNIAPENILHHVRKNGARVRPKHHYHRKYHCNANAFDCQTKASAYWLGFLMADGSVNRSTISIEIHQKDIKQLDNFNTFLSSNYPIQKSRKKCYRLDITSKPLVEKLNEIGIVQNKTQKNIFPQINESYTNHFIRGFFDGDGWLTSRKTNQKYLIFDFGFSSNSYLFLYYIKSWFELQLGKKCQKIINKTNKHSHSCYQFAIAGKSKFIQAGELLYKDSKTNTRLDRKYNQWKNAKATILY